MDITLQVNKKNDVDVVRYLGPINEEAEVHLATLLENVGKKCIIDFQNVAYINSCGVRAWINFMREFEKGRSIAFEKCTPEIVMQINMIPSFKASANILSVYGSYSCSNCSHHQTHLFEDGRDMPKSVDDQLPAVKCEKCGSEMELDELEDEFFSFALQG